MSFFLPGDKKLGVSTKRRRYDLPLNKDAGNGFLILLVALMTFLGVMALAGSFALGAMTSHWSSGLENKITIEIKAESKNGNIRTQKDIEVLASQIEVFLKKQNFVHTADVLGRAEIKELISPWLGDTDDFSDIPLPGLISVEVLSMNEDMLKNLINDLQKIDPAVVVDTHESWLNDILKLTGSLQLATFLMTLMIGLTTIAAIAGAVKSRIAIHKKDVELLHLMGASDIYISRQFQRHTLILAFQGSLAGTIAGALVLLIIGFFAGNTGEAMLPEFQLNMFHIFTLITLPVAACIIAAITAKITVLRELALMP